MKAVTLTCMPRHIPQSRLLPDLCQIMSEDLGQRTQSERGCGRSDCDVGGVLGIVGGTPTLVRQCPYECGVLGHFC